MKIRNKRGFSLIELLASVLIVAILAAIALPMYEKVVTRSRTAEVNNLLSMVRTRQIKKFATDRQYATRFTDDALKKIALGPSDYEVNNGAFKTVNNNYELELIDNTVTDPETNQPIAQRCVIGRYKPNGGAAQFAFAIAYDKSGLACEDKNSDPENYTKEVCSMFGTVTSDDIDALCSGTAAGMGELCESVTCGPCEYLNPDTCTCSQNIPPLLHNHVFDPNKEDEPKCQSCKYVSQENPEAPFEQWYKRLDTDNHTVVAVPNIGDQLFSCVTEAATLGDPQRDESASDEEEGVTYYSNCHSAYFKEWSDDLCDWTCPETGEGLCKEGEVWNRNLCKCVCFGKCQCHETQRLVGGENCECIAPSDEVENLGPLEGCICKARPSYGELDNGDRFLNNDSTHCRCNTSRTPVFYGTITDKNKDEHTIDIENAHDLATAYESDSNENYWLAACCLHDHLWKVNDPGFAFHHNACCPYTEYIEQGVETSEHIQFNVNTEECCPADELFYNSEDTENKTDPNSQYENRPAGTYQTGICHKCKDWYQAWDQSTGCYTCPGKTFTTWNDSAKVSECSCPTGTDGDNTISATGENCQCKKANAEWISSINYIENASTGPVGDNVWHAHNGACKCVDGFGDTYWGMQLADANATSGATVSYDDGYCCPSALVTSVYDDNNTATGQQACCPAGKKFFHNTTYASNTCGVCQNQYDTVVNGECQPCPGNMVPRYNSDLGYSTCECPQGMKVNPNASVATGVLVDTCICNLENAEWDAPANTDWKTSYVNNYITNTSTTMPGSWDQTHGYCKCKSPDYVFATYGNINTEDGTTSGTTVPSTGYCCPSDQCHESTNYNPARSYCCDVGIAFNPDNTEAGGCCSSPAQHYSYDLSQLASYGLTESGRAGKDAYGNVIDSQATVGGCARCDNPTYDADCNPCNASLANKTNAVPRVPVWNNNGSDGYSTCECPSGTQEEEPSWWESFLIAIHVTTWDPDCYCTVPNSTWQDGKCKCHEDYTYSTADDQESYCCPNDEPVYSGSSEDGHDCCPTIKPYYYEGECHECPKATPYLWSDNECHQCPVGNFEYGGFCCENNLGDIGDREVYQVVYATHNYCSLCEECGTGCPEEAPYIWNSEANQLECSCLNGATYEPENENPCNDCPQQDIDNGTQSCGCQTCAENNDIDFYENGNFTGLGMYWSGSQCMCQAGHSFDNACCTDSNVDCCPCADGYEAATIGDLSLMVNGCCASANYNSDQEVCCGRVTLSNNTSTPISYAQGACCPSVAPYLYNEVKCARCSDPANQWWDITSQKCKTCPYPKELGSWSDEYYAITTCNCPPGTSANGQGGSLGGTPDLEPLNKDLSRTTNLAVTGSQCDGACCCNIQGTTWDATSKRCVCASGFFDIVDDNNVLTRCCPSSQYISSTKTCCRSGTHPSTSDDDQTRCCPTGTELFNYGTSPDPYRCAQCPPDKILVGNQCVDCPTGKIVDEDSWSDQDHAYKQCMCDITKGLSETGLGGKPSNVDECACESDKQYLYENLTGPAPYADGSCKTCGQGYWNSTVGRCDCYRGFTWVNDNGNGKCVCDEDSGKHTWRTTTLMACNYSEPNCQCGPCPNNTYYTNVSGVEGCYCEYKHDGKPLVSSGDYRFDATFTTSPVFQAPNECTIVNDVPYNGRTGYCIFHCNNTNPYDVQGGVLMCKESEGCGEDTTYSLPDSVVGIHVPKPNPHPGHVLSLRSLGCRTGETSDDTCSVGKGGDRNDPTILDNPEKTTNIDGFDQLEPIDPGRTLGTK